MEKMRKNACLLALLLAFMMMTGCSALPAEPSSGPDVAARQEAAAFAARLDRVHTDLNGAAKAGIAAVPGTDILDSGSKRVGASGYGYADVPASWLDFTDIDGDGSARQYSDPTGSCILTLQFWTPQEGMTAESTAAALRQNMEEEGAVGVVGATVSLGGYTAYQIYGLYADEDLMLVIWIFAEESGQLHFVSMEAPTGDILELVSGIEESYALTA